MNSAEVMYNLGPIVDWVEAIGTLAAVIVSLWLALRRKKEKLSIHSEYLNGSYYFWIVNNSEFNVSIELIGIREYIPKLKRYWMNLFDQYVPESYIGDWEKPIFYLLHPGETSKKYIYTENKLKKICGVTKLNSYPVEILFDDGNGKSIELKTYLTSYQKQ